MEFITDRTFDDVLKGNAKGFYNHTDLNRVESAVAAISDALGLQLVTKTDWRMGGSYPENWPTEAQLQRYLGNVQRIGAHFGFAIALPTSTAELNYAGANAIEQVLAAAWQTLFSAQTNQEEHIHE